MIIWLPNCRRRTLPLERLIISHHCTGFLAAWSTPALSRQPFARKAWSNCSRVDRKRDAANYAAVFPGVYWEARRGFFVSTRTHTSPSAGIDAVVCSHEIFENSLYKSESRVGALAPRSKPWIRGIAHLKAITRSLRQITQKTHRSLKLEQLDLQQDYPGVRSCASRCQGH